MSTFPPRECGIATFTRDLTDAMDRNFSLRIESKLLAMNKNLTSIYDYPKKVLFQINDTEIQDYIDMAKEINNSEKIKLVNIQHEFGIFGGRYGSYLLIFLELLEKPVVITFHSVLPKPNDKLKRVVRALANKAECIIVMTNVASKILKKTYKVKIPIVVVPHGIPFVRFSSGEKEKKLLGLKNKIVLSSISFLGLSKGYEYVIEAMPKVIKKFPNIIYLIIGLTHPVLRKKEGEKYRNFLEKKIKNLNLGRNVKFYNKYISLKEVIKYLKATDIYICSSQNAKQVSSGTLVYALGAGKAVVSTPFLQAKELKSSIGCFAKFKNPKSFAEAIIKLLSDPVLKENAEKNSYENTRYMLWDNVALEYNKIFEQYLKK